FRFGPLSALDVGADAVPLDDAACFIAQWIRAKEEPPVFTVVPTETCLGFSRRFRDHDALPRCGQITEIVLMDGRRPAPTAGLFCSKAGDIRVMLVEELCASI